MVAQKIKSLWSKRGISLPLFLLTAVEKTTFEGTMNNLADAFHPDLT
jgi:hypothetical protein